MADDLEVEMDATPNQTAIHDDLWTTADACPEHSIARLIKMAEQRQAWHIEGLWQPRAIVLVHSLEGGFKSIFAYQISEALATAQPLLRQWSVPAALRVGVLQTEMPESMVGERLKSMYPDGHFPTNLIVSDEWLSVKIRQEFSASGKFQAIHNWLMREKIDILTWDTINNVLASCGNPNSEEAAAQFYNSLELLPHKGALVVRHDSKPSKDTGMRQNNQKVRGSNLHAEVASAIIGLERSDKRSQKVSLAVGKLRHGNAPDPMECWSDAGVMRLTLLSPPVALLENGPMSREDLNEQLSKRFSIKDRAADELTASLKAEGLLVAETHGHERVWALNQAAEPKPETPASLWWPLVKRG